ncbi:hypothetical protein [Nonomuraea wenchangensis]|uniref:hypothetical protein n=1 Tax=Nonomuraea wenchangensis TaxID=568860 RepID=UPI0033177462
MPHGDDLDQRFNELVGQIDDDERRRMRAEATRAAKEARSRRPPRQERGRRTRLSGSRGYDDFGGSGGSGDCGPAARPRRWLRALTVVSAVVAAAGLVVAFRPGLLAPSGALLEEAVAPVVDAVSPDPYAGSPAAGYADGIAGFVLPEARAMGGLSRKDVAKGLERVRELLAAAYLDRRTLEGGAPDAFVAALDRDQRETFSLAPGRDAIGRESINTFAPGTAVLATDVVKVKGEITLRAFDDGDLRGVEVKLNHLVVYAVHRPGLPRSVIRVVTHPTGRVQLYRDGGRLVAWVTGWSASATPASCDFDDGYIHPVYDDFPAGTVAPTGVPSDPYVLDEEPGEGGCGSSKTT